MFSCRQRHFIEDLTVQKMTQMGCWESGKREIGTQFFEVFNHSNFGTPVRNGASPLIDQISSLTASPKSIPGRSLKENAYLRLIQLKAWLTLQPTSQCLARGVMPMGGAFERDFEASFYFAGAHAPGRGESLTPVRLRHYALLQRSDAQAACRDEWRASSDPATQAPEQASRMGNREKPQDAGHESETQSLGEMCHAESRKALERARESVAGGDSSNMRVLACHPPLVAERGAGCRVWDVDGNEYIDMNLGYGPLLFGHRPGFLIDAVVKQVKEKGSHLGFPQELNYLAGEKVKRLFPSMERLRFANSGTEAAASAVRLARACTGRPNLLLFEGHYHGWSDALFHKYHASEEELGSRNPAAALAGTIGMNGAPHHAYVTGWNDAERLADALEELKGTVAAVVMEPVMGNAGVIEPEPGYLAAARELTRKHGALLVFDEVITGMRVAAGGAQQRYGIVPDLTVISKALGGGYPVAAFGGRADLMEEIGSGRMFHGGVYAGNAMVLAAANAVLSKVLKEKEEIYPALEARAGQLADGLRGMFARRGVGHVVQRVGAMLGLALTQGVEKRPRNYREMARVSDGEAYMRFQRELLARGVYVHPNHFEPMYLSTEHSQGDVDEVLGRIEDTLRHARS